MSDKSNIEWTATRNPDGTVTPGSTWNPLLGCSKVSAGCMSCYAIQTAWVKQHNPNPTIAAAYAGLVEKRPDGSLNWTGRINLIPERLEIPFRWREPRRIFVNSLSDLFHKNVPDEFIAATFGVMALTPRHTYQVLTKRPERMARWVKEYTAYECVETLRLGAAGVEALTDPVCRAIDDWQERRMRDERPGVWPLPNVWLGTSTEDQATADERIPHLLRAPAAVRFLSMEPLLGSVNLESYLVLYGRTLGEPVAPRGALHWVITGGESGHGFRPCDPEWVRSLRDQCVAADVAFFHKQWGGRTPKAAGRLLDGREWNQFPTVRTVVPA